MRGTWPRQIAKIYSHKKIWFVFMMALVSASPFTRHTFGIDTTAMTTLTREAIFDTIKAILVDSLAADDEDVTLEARLTTDLGAESIDFLDIAFKLERAFGFTNIQKELLPEGSPSDPRFVKEGKLTPEGVVALKTRLPHVNFTAFEKDPQITKIAECFTVGSLVAFVERKLASK